MLHTEFTPEAVAAAKARLYDRMAQRRMDAEDEELFSMFQSRPFEKPPVLETAVDAQWEAVAEAPRVNWFLVVVWTTVEFLRRINANDWLFILVAVLIGTVIFGLRML